MRGLTDWQRETLKRAARLSPRQCIPAMNSGHLTHLRGLAKRGLLRESTEEKFQITAAGLDALEGVPA
jgi:hypothetical protein